MNIVQVNPNKQMLFKMKVNLDPDLQTSSQEDVIKY